MKQEYELDLALLAIQQASTAVMKIYYSNKTMHAEKKSDHSPVTKADLISNQIICQLLEDQSPYPILSEENKDNLTRLSTNKIWILDPLDGTKEFISKNGEFTINLALVENGVSILGVIACPVQNSIYYAMKSQGAYILQNTKRNPIHVGSKKACKDLIVAVSRSHMHPSISEVLKKIKNNEQVQRGSALKYCHVADGSIDATIRRTPLSEWDIAAADCILKEAGGRITNLIGVPFKYNNKKTIIESGIIACGKDLHPQLLSLFQ